MKISVHNKCIAGAILHYEIEEYRQKMVAKA